ncbi:MAG: biotin--[acetyl-CoA-carboxylase] ligase [Clostridia bacterium]|nr:MAG: biotin--[acetyl-CoA-carboxylase] ligase [Clostridia bacterium]
MTKNAVYAALAGTEDYVSGSALAKALGISRNSIFKAVEQLRKTGIPVEAVKNRGYRLCTDGRLREEAITAGLMTEDIGRTLYLHPLLPSTNDRVKSLAAEGAPHGLLVVADHQSAGRGRRGRVFFSPPGSGVYMSVLLRTPMNARKVGLLTSMAAVAVAEAIESLLPVQVQIKWVNDLLINGKKVCGILTEGSLSAETLQCAYAVVGIGINVSTAAFPSDLQRVASSLLLEAGRAPDRAVLIAAVCNRLETRFATMDSGDFLKESRRRSAVIGKTVTVLSDGRYTAVARGIDDDGHLVVETADGLKTLHAGEVSLRL